MTPDVDVCLISSSPPSSNPRLVKEASALTGAGYRVHCVVAEYETGLSGNDEQVLHSTGASWTRVKLGSGSDYRLRRAGQIAAARIPTWLSTDKMVARSSSVQCSRLARAACSVLARLFIGHTLPGLPAAVFAARRHNAIAGFDAEDFHSGESSDDRRNSIARKVESRFLSHCRHRTCAAPLIGNAYQQTYGVAMAPILNTFPLPEGFLPRPRPRTAQQPLSLYWFSQTVGPGRGLEEVLRAISRATCPILLHCRGTVDPAYRASLIVLAGQLRLRHLPEFLPPASPEAMVPCAADFDVGLSVELENCVNHRLCLANKIFTYLAAGRPQFLSATQAQREFGARLGDAATVIDLNDSEGFGRALDELASSPGKYSRACEAAIDCFSQQYSWEHESKRLLKLVADSLGEPGKTDWVPPTRPADTRETANA